jgi:hypothetical protein
MPSMRFRVKPRDVPLDVAARIMGMSAEAFRAALPGLIARKFPAADPTTGNFDRKAIKQWQNSRHPHLFAVEKPPSALDASVGLKDRLRGHS